MNRGMHRFLVAVVWLVAFPSVLVDANTNIITLTGDWETVAKGLGQQTSSILALRLTMPDFQQMLPWMETPVGQALYHQLLNTSTEIFPEFVQELRWIAQGANFSFQNLFYINALDEIEAYMDQVGFNLLLSSEANPSTRQRIQESQAYLASKRKIGHCT
jgi:hypothetical protein